ncbi:hypothetical protein Pelo_18832 [Pelomyxa schiedti]|nr:hypothetical protein Pelo_18832 [Pelomyxa schiedti]
MVLPYVRPGITHSETIPDWGGACKLGNTSICDGIKGVPGSKNINSYSGLPMVPKHRWSITSHSPQIVFSCPIGFNQDLQGSAAVRCGRLFQQEISTSHAIFVLAALAS